MQNNIIKIMELAIELKEKGHHVFFEFSPHVGTTTVRVFENGWIKGKEANFNNHFYCYENDFTSKFKIATNFTNCIEYLEGLK